MQFFFLHFSWKWGLDKLLWRAFLKQKWTNISLCIIAILFSLFGPTNEHWKIPTSWTTSTRNNASVFVLFVYKIQRIDSQICGFSRFLPSLELVSAASLLLFQPNWSALLLGNPSVVILQADQLSSLILSFFWPFYFVSPHGDKSSFFVIKLLLLKASIEFYIWFWELGEITKRHKILCRSQKSYWFLKKIDFWFP